MNSTIGKEKSFMMIGIQYEERKRAFMTDMNSTRGKEKSFYNSM
jgi:hypothetical protein